jgi:hypothetical protein
MLRLVCQDPESQVLMSCCDVVMFMNMAKFVSRFQHLESQCLKSVTHDVPMSDVGPNISLMKSEKI